jgi:arylsulfatase A-like enzyme
VAAGFVAAALLLALVDAAATDLTLPLPRAGGVLRLATHFYDLGESLGVGVSAGLAAGAIVGLRRAPRWALAGAAFATTAALVNLAIGENLTRVASLTLDGRCETLLFDGYLAVLSVAIPVAFAFGISCSQRPFLRLLLLVLALAVMGIDHVIGADEFQGIHGVIACGAALLGGGALSAIVERAIFALAESRKGRSALVVVGLFSCLGVVLPPPNAIRYELFRQPCAVAPWVLATTIWRAPRLHNAVSPSSSQWLGDRTFLPPVPPTPSRLLPPGAVVVLVTIDATRFDVVGDAANDDLLPTLTEFKRHGVFFTHASAPASQTALSLGTLFSGRYYSEQYWTDHGVGESRFLYPSEDTQVRFPEILSAHGVRTANFAGLIFLSNEYGVVRGFQEETVTVTGARHAEARELIDPLLNQLRGAGSGPLFFYTHLIEPHEPYDRGRKDGTPRERYLSEVAVADAQIGRVEHLLEEQFGRRWALIVSADHGEAFGEHGETTHGKSLYEPLIHVPLLARSPAFTPRSIDQPVSLVDLGPTILDLFGLDTPASFLGQSLVPLLAGGVAELTRPIIAEGRLRRSLTTTDGLKVIEDERRKVVEVYDLSKDPGETLNLFDVEPGRSDRALAALRAFFAVHKRTAGGYAVPFKP